MKVKNILALTLFSAAALSSCMDLDEDPRASLTPATYFKTQADLDGAVASMYRKLAIDGAWGFTNRMTSYFGADDITTHPGLNKEDFREFDRLMGSANNTNLVCEWEGPWKAIYQANNVLANYETVQGSTEAKINQSAGEAYFIRALGYFYLVRTFGELPLVTEQIDVNDRPDRQPVATIYEQIVSDFNEAYRLLTSENRGSGVPNKLACKAFLSQVYLTMAGWPLNDTSKYADAANAAKEVINAGRYSLEENYLDVFETNNSKEHIFSLYYNIGADLPQRSFGSSAIPLDEGGWEDFKTERNFFKNAPKCKRTDQTFYTEFKVKDESGNWIKRSWDDPANTNAFHPYFNKFRHGTNQEGCVEDDVQIYSHNASTNKSLDIIRYANVLLDYAEAACMASGAPTADAYAAINEVRQRAGLPDLESGLSQQAFRDAVVYERAYECAGEFGTRWFDIVRLQMLPEIIAQRDPTEECSLDPATAANPSHCYLAPIPFKEMVRNPNWKQNPGYGD